MSVISTATIRTTNLKENKEKRNREKLLATGAHGSEFSLDCNEGDLEMDYYDYNVVNAGAAPGSYLGMDPAFLVWIPPLDDDGEILPEEQQRELYEDLKPKHFVDPGSNQESPEQELTVPKKTDLFGKQKREKLVSIQLHEFPKVKLGSPVRVHREKETRVEKSPSCSVDSNILDDIKFADEDDDVPDEGNLCNNVPYRDNSNVLSTG